MPFQGIGNVQTTKYGSRVRVRVGYKDIYGPYRRTVDCARLDLAKLHGEHRSSEEKKALLLQLKLAIGVRRGGRNRSYCRGNDNVDDVDSEEARPMFAAADAEDVQDKLGYQQMLAKALGANIWDSVGPPQNPHMDDAEDDEVEDERQTRVTLCTAADVPLRTEVHREAEVAPINIVSCTSGSVGCLDAKDSARVKGEAGQSKKTQWKQVRLRFRIAGCRKKGEVSDRLGKGC